jgi:hypothetical protein
MNSLTKTTKTAGAAVLLSFLTLFFPFIAVPQESGDPHLSRIHEDLTPEQEKSNARKAKRAAVSAAAGVFKKTPAWKHVKRIRKRITEKYSFEFRKRFSDTGGSEAVPDTKTDEKTQKSGELVFSGGIGSDMKPSLSLVSGFKPADVAVRFDVLDQELDCEISSRPVDRMMGGRTSLGLSSDGGKSQAILKISFDF